MAKSQLTKTLLLLISFSLIASCKKDQPITSSSDSTPNILLIIADDMGKDATNGFPGGAIKPNTPNIDAIKDQGISFTNFWAYPSCSPTRASIITGKYGYRTGVKWANDDLGSSETILQKYIQDRSSKDYATAIIGKWHLSGARSLVNPENFGMDYYIGLATGTVSDYYKWPITENRVVDTSTTYITEHLTDLALDWVNTQTKPWFLWLAYNAPHTPFHVPPPSMHSQGALTPFLTGADPIPYFLAAIEALDYQIGRFLSGIPESEKENTLIIFIGDNGSPGQSAQAPYSSSTVKGTLYQGGINTPLFVQGKGVARFGVQDDNLINSTDLFATIASIAGVSLTEIHDSKSFKGLLTKTSTIRDYQYSETDNGTIDQWCISNGEHKIVADVSGTIRMYDLKIDPYESNNLIGGSLSAEELTAKAELEIEMTNIRN